MRRPRPGAQRGVVFEPAVDLVAEEQRPCPLRDRDKPLEGRPVELVARRIVREVDEDPARLWLERLFEGIEVKAWSPASSATLEKAKIASSPPANTSTSSDSTSSYSAAIASRRKGAPGGSV
jgi:hypothetical protein